MISYVRGLLAEVLGNTIIVEVQNIGYQISVPSSLLSFLPALGQEVKIYTYLQVREDALQLFGFLSRDDLEMFLLCIAVNGIGPKAALGILSSITPDDLRFAILSDDVKTIAKAPGIGPKTAKKMILELKDRLSLEDAFEKKLTKGGDENRAPGMSASREEAVQALVSLGYSATEALRAVQASEITEEDDVEAILKKALKQLSLF